jgi:hypothetical protein
MTLRIEAPLLDAPLGHGRFLKHEHGISFKFKITFSHRGTFKDSILATVLHYLLKVSTYKFEGTK